MTPFYPEGGGQVGDSGYIEAGGKKYSILDTKRENNLIIHITRQLPEDLGAPFKAVVDAEKRRMSANHHTATHLLHKALRKFLGDHVEQKGSLVHPDYLRFDFSHFQKLTDEEIRAVEHEVNREIRLNFPVDEHRELPLSKAKEMGAMALFGEKYGDVVRAIRFGDSVELCGGTHVSATGQIGMFRIISEASVAAGIRRIEAVVADKAEALFDAQTDLLKQLEQMFKNQSNLHKNVEALMHDNSALVKQMDAMRQGLMQIEKRSISDAAKTVQGVVVMSAVVKPALAGHIKDLAFQLRGECEHEMVAVLGGEIDGKVQLSVIVTEALVKAGTMNAVELIRAVSPAIQGGGGGQPFFATAGGKNPAGLNDAIEKALVLIEEALQKK
jgi:alanyl-tRNA synthetase